VIVGVRDRIDIPVRIVIQLRGVVLKIGVAEEELLRSRARDSWADVLLVERATQEQ
jgi:hypothetical protein